MGKSPKAPEAMNVGAVTQQANTQNTQNAYQNSAFNRVNQTDQFGNTLNYSQTGTDAQGNPIFNATQGMGQTAQQFAGGLGAMGQRYMDTAGQAPQTSMDAMNRAYDSATAFSAPRMEREKQQMNTQLANMGLDPSSEAYRNRMMDVTEQQSNQQNTLAASLQGQMFNQGLQGRQQQMNELQPGMQYGMGTMNPNLVNAPQVGVQNVDVAGLNSQNYAQQMEAYKAKQAQQGAMLGGLGGIAGSVMMAPMTGGGSLGGMLGGKLLGGLGLK
jgi:hypothetical protein